MRHSTSLLTTITNDGRKGCRYIIAVLAGLVSCSATQDVFAQRAPLQMQSPGMMGHPFSSPSFNNMPFMPEFTNPHYGHQANWSTFNSPMNHNWASYPQNNMQRNWGTAGSYARGIPYSLPQVAGGVNQFMPFSSAEFEPGFFPAYYTGRISIDNPTKGPVKASLRSDEGRWFLDVPAKESRWLEVPIGIYSPRFKFLDDPTVLQGNKLTLTRGSQLTIRLEKSADGNYPLRPVSDKPQRGSKKARR